jgi:hypothetical protein
MSRLDVRRLGKNQTIPPRDVVALGVIDALPNGQNAVDVANQMSVLVTRQKDLE